MLLLRSCPTLCDPMDCSPPGSSVQEFSRQEYSVGCHALLQGIFLTQGSNLHLLWLLNCRQIFFFLPLSHCGSPKLTYDPASPLLGMYPKKAIIEKDTCTAVIIAALFIIARTWKQHGCPSTGE